MEVKEIVWSLGCSSFGILPSLEPSSKLVPVSQKENSYFLD